MTVATGFDLFWGCLINLNPSELKWPVIIFFQKSIVMKLLILFVYLQIVPEGANYYSIIFKKTKQNYKMEKKLLGKFILFMINV